MSTAKDLKSIALRYFTPLENDIYKCSCGKILKQKTALGGPTCEVPGTNLQPPGTIF